MSLTAAPMGKAREMREPKMGYHECIQKLFFKNDLKPMMIMLHCKDDEMGNRDMVVLLQ